MPTNHRAIVDRVFAGGAYDLSTKEGCGAFTRSCAMAVHAMDARFGMLKKDGGNHVVDRFERWHAVDSILMMETPTRGIAFDIISNSATERARPAWIVDRYTTGPQKGELAYRYDGDDWFVPNYDGETWPPPGTPTPPAPTPAPPAPAPRFRFHTYDALINGVDGEPSYANQVDVAYVERHGHLPATTDQWHNAYRLMVEGWAIEDVLADIRK